MPLFAGLIFVTENRLVLLQSTPCLSEGNVANLDNHSGTTLPSGVTNFPRTHFIPSSTHILNDTSGTPHTTFTTILTGVNRSHYLISSNDITHSSTLSIQHEALRAHFIRKRTCSFGFRHTSKMVTWNVCSK